MQCNVTSWRNLLTSGWFHKEGWFTKEATLNPDPTSGLDSGSSRARMAVEYVYALHEFVPQNDDEIDFEAGERIAVIEKDDLYGDGWWTVSYTTTHCRHVRSWLMLSISGP